MTIKSVSVRITGMNTQELLFMTAADREFAEMDAFISTNHPEYASVPEEKRRVAYFLVSRISTQKMPKIAQLAKVSTGKCYDLVKEPECRIAQSAAGKYLSSVKQQKFQNEINQATGKIGRLARAKKLAAPQFTKDMRRVCKAAEPVYQLSPVEFFYLGVKMNEYLTDNTIAPDQECLNNVKAQLTELEP